MNFKSIVTSLAFLGLFVCFAVPSVLAANVNSGSVCKDGNTLLISAVLDSDVGELTLIVYDATAGNNPGSDDVLHLDQFTLPLVKYTSDYFSWDAGNRTALIRVTLDSDTLDKNYVVKIGGSGITEAFALYTDDIPDITLEPQDVVVTAGETAELKVTASGTGASLSYCWYEATNKSDRNGVPVSGATSAAFNPPTSIVGTRFYYCVVSNINSTSTKTASQISASASVTVTAAPNYSASISPDTIAFVSADLGYSNASMGCVFTITNTGDAAISNLAASLGSSNFEIFTPLSATSLAPGGTATLSVRPKAGLGAQIYTDTLTITGDKGISLTASLSFIVTKGEHKASWLWLTVNGTKQLIFLGGGQLDNSVREALKEAFLAEESIVVIDSNGNQIDFGKFASIDLPLDDMWGKPQYEPDLSDMYFP